MRLTSLCGGKPARTGRSKQSRFDPPGFLAGSINLPDGRPARSKSNTRILVSPRSRRWRPSADRGSDAPIGRTTPDFPRHGSTACAARWSFNADMKTARPGRACWGCLPRSGSSPIMVCLIVVTVPSAGYKLLMRGTVTDAARRCHGPAGAVVGGHRDRNAFQHDLTAAARPLVADRASDQAAVSQARAPAYGIVSQPRRSPGRRR